MTKITREGDIKLEVISYGCRRRAKEKKTDNEQLTWERKKKQIKDWKKNIHAKPVNIDKKKSKKEPENVFDKKNGKTKMKDDTNIFLFPLTFEFCDCYFRFS